MGAGIEIFALKSMDNVAPHIGAWVEIANPLRPSDFVTLYIGA